MSRSILHISKLEEFKKYLDSIGVKHRLGRGDFEVLRVLKDGKTWCCVYARLDMPEHYTTDKRLDRLVRSFCNNRSV